MKWCFNGLAGLFVLLIYDQLKFFKNNLCCLLLVHCGFDNPHEREDGDLSSKNQISGYPVWDQQ